MSELHQPTVAAALCHVSRAEAPVADPIPGDLLALVFAGPLRSSNLQIAISHTAVQSPGFKRFDLDKHPNLIFGARFGFLPIWVRVVSTEFFS